MKNPANLQSWLSYIEALHPSEIELGLQRVDAVAQALGVKQFAVPVITVAGTNGKGSTLAYLESILHQAGYRTGLFTSPHFLRYNERIRLCTREASDAEICSAFAAIERRRKQLHISLSYFEYGTLAALWLFQQQPLDVVLLEVGLGGRLDAVNIIDADIAIVTTVALDHESWLGSDREQIGREKAGIFRPGRPALYGEPDMPDSVAEVASNCGARLMRWGQDFSAELAAGQTPGDVPGSTSRNWCWRGVDRHGQAVRIEQLPYPQLPFDNAVTAVATIKQLPLPVTDDAIRTGLEAARLTGRQQQVQYNNRLIILDVAHNPHAAAHLAARLNSHPRPLVAVVGMLSDKATGGTLIPLLPLIKHWYFGTLDVARGQSADALARAWDTARQQPAANCQYSCYASVISAFDQALATTPLRHSGNGILLCQPSWTLAPEQTYDTDPETPVDRLCRYSRHCCHRAAYAV